MELLSVEWDWCVVIGSEYGACFVLCSPEVALMLGGNTPFLYSVIRNPFSISLSLSYDALGRKEGRNEGRSRNYISSGYLHLIVLVDQI